MYPRLLIRLLVILIVVESLFLNPPGHRVKCTVVYGRVRTIVCGLYHFGLDFFLFETVSKPSVLGQHSRQT